MEEKRMIEVTVEGEVYTYPHGTPYRVIPARSFWLTGMENSVNSIRSWIGIVH